MRPVYQTKFETNVTRPDDPDAWGDCFSACVASILEIELSEVPVFAASPTGSWFLAFEEWARSRSLGVVVSYTEGAPWYISPGVLAIASGKSPRGEWRHSVVMDGLGEIVHDPRPEGGGLDGNATEIMFLVPTGPIR